ncbi:MAG: HAMP domain-containing sensor histidine kinase [Siculibacillus sp.]
MSAATDGRRRLGRLLGSTTVRFVAVIAGVFTLAFLALSLLVWTTVSGYIERRIADTIATDVAGLEDVWRAGGETALAAAILRRRAEGGEGARERIRIVVGADGTKIAGDFAAWPNDLAPESGAVEFADPRGDRAYSGRIRRIPDGPVLLVAHDRAEHDRLAAALLGDLAGPFLAALLVALVVTALVGRRLLARIERVNAVARAVEAGDLAARVGSPGGGDEFARLAAHVDAMLDRIDVLMRGIRHLSDHIAHEMRTPLARLRARLERARREAEADPSARGAVAAFDDAVAETAELIAVFSALLDIARTEAATGDAGALVEVDLAEVIATVVDLYEGVAEERGVRLLVDAVPAVTLGEPMALTRMFANLVDNAVKFSPEGADVDLGVAVGPGEIRLWVRDHGPGLPPGFETSAFERFTRADNAGAVPGHGLGLPFVRAVALRHGMRIALERADPGLRVVLRIPRPSP